MKTTTILLDTQVYVISRLCNDNTRRYRAVGGTWVNDPYSAQGWGSYEYAQAITHGTNWVVLPRM